MQTNTKCSTRENIHVLFVKVLLLCTACLKKKSSSSKTSAASTQIDSLSVQMKKSSLTLRILKVEIGNNWFRLYDRSSTMAKFVITSCRDRKSWKELSNKRHVFSFRQTRINNKRTTKYYICILVGVCSFVLDQQWRSIVNIAHCIFEDNAL